MNRILLNTTYLFITLLAISSCTEQKPYEFFVAGHVYGSPGTKDLGVYHVFKEEFDALRNNPKIEFGVFTGDIVKKSRDENWNAIDEDVIELGLPVYFVAGNHDIKEDSLMFEKRYGKSYYSLTRNNDLFVVLDGNINGWNIEGEQLQFLKDAVSNNQRVNNIFIFVHQVIWWWGGDKKYAKLGLNSTEGKSNILKYWQDVHPVLFESGKNVYIFAGDVGAANWSDNFMYGREDNVAFIASGMGGWDGDNYVRVSVLGAAVSITMHLFREDREFLIPRDTFMIY